MFQAFINLLFPARAENALSAALLISEHGPALFDRIAEKTNRMRMPFADYVRDPAHENVLTWPELLKALESDRYNPTDSLVIKLMQRNLKQIGHEIGRTLITLPRGGTSVSHYGASRHEICSYATRVMQKQGLLYSPPEEEDFYLAPFV